MYYGENEEALSRDVYDDYDVSLTSEMETPEGFFSPFTFLCFAVILVLFGLLTLFSASYDVSLRNGWKFYTIFLNETIALSIGLLISIPLLFVPVRIYRKAYFLLYPVYLILALLSIFYFDFVDPSFTALLGNINIALLMGDFLTSLSADKDKKGFLLILLAFLISLVLVSETMVGGEGWFFLSFILIISTLAAKKIKTSYIVFYIVSLIVFFVLMSLLSSTILERNTILLFSLDGSSSVTLSKHAVREGELFGVGIGNGLYKLGLIDGIEGMYIFASLSEEMGLTGTLIIIFSLMIVLIIGIRTSNRAYKKDDIFSSVFSLSLTVIFVFSYIINMFYVSGIFPLGEGVSLLLFSYSPSLEALTVIMLAVLYKFIYLVGREKQ